MAEKTCKIERGAALALMKAAGWGTANKWNNDRIAKRITQMKDLIDEDFAPEDESVAGTLIDVLSAIEDELGFEIYDADADSEEVEESNEDDSEEEEETVDDQVDGENQDEKSEKEEKKEPKRRGRRRGRKPKKEKSSGSDSDDEESESILNKFLSKATPEERKAILNALKKERKSGINGVRPTKNRAYHAGRLIKKSGLKVGVSDDMVKQIDELCGASGKNTRFQCVNAWNAINGYLDEVVVH